MKKEINVSCVYCILNKHNGKRYVGSTTRFSHRKSDHLCRLRKGKHYSIDLQSDFREFGERAFVIFKLEDVYTFDKEELLNREQFWIDKYSPEYNLNPLAGNFTSYARIQSAEWHKIHGHKRVQSAAERKKRSESLIKYHATHETRLSEDRKAHLRKINLGEGNPNYGLRRSKETLEKMSKSMSKKVWSGFISPDGVEYRGIVNITEFAKEHNLSNFSLYQLASGRIKHHKRWKLISDRSGVLP